MAPPSINVRFEITASNKWLDVWDAAGGNQSIQATEQWYDDMPAFCTEIEGKLQALGGTWAAATVTVVFDGAVAAGQIRINSNQAINACSILWNTGAHGGGFLDSHCGDELGFDDAADDVGAFTYDSDFQHRFGWYATRAVKSMGPLLAEHVGSPIRKTLDGRNAKRLTVKHVWRYAIELEAIEGTHYHILYNTGTNLNRPLQACLVYMTEGYRWRWREDQEVLGTSYEFYMEEPAQEYKATKRKYPDYEGYDLSISAWMRS